MPNFFEEKNALCANAMQEKISEKLANFYNQRKYQCECHMCRLTNNLCNVVSLIQNVRANFKRIFKPQTLIWIYLN